MNEKEIEKELEQLPDEWQATFAARVVAQFLPSWIKKETPDYHYSSDFSKKKSNNILFPSLRTIAFHEFRSSKKLRGFTDFIPSFALRLDIDIANELTFLKKHLNSDKTAADYLYQPLYASQSQEWLQRGQEFVQVLRDYGHGFDIWADWFQGRIDGVPTNKEFLEAVVNLPAEILAQKPAQINAYLKNLCQTERPLNRVRVIFLGYGEAGKTSLIRALKGLEVVAGKEQMTPGIDISDWQVPGTEITAHFWDFGGQVVAHATHQFFLRSRCLYILLLDGRTEINANEQAEYWLEHVRAFGSKAPVMLVGNKADLCAVNLDMAALKEKHGNVLDFYPLSCTKYQEEYAAHFQRFQADLIKQVAELGVHTVRFGKAHLAVLDELTSRSSTESFLKKTAWLDLCQDSGLAEQGDLNQAWLLDLFDKLGVIVYFPNIDALDSYILNPRWLTYGVYTLLYSLEAKAKKGRLREAEIVRILSEAEVRDNLGNVLSYPPDKAWIVLKAMEEFDLSFRCRHKADEIVIPDLLESDQPQHGFEKRDSLAFEFNFTGFLPRHIMSNFIVAFHDEIYSDFVWQNGVVLHPEDETAEALVQVDYHDRKLFILVYGNKSNVYFNILYREIKKILKKMSDIRFDEFVIVPESSRIDGNPLPFHRNDQLVRADFQDLLALEKSGATEYVCKAGKFDLGKILQIMPEQYRSAYQEKEILATLQEIKQQVVPKEKSFGEQMGGSIELKPGIFGVSVDVKTAIKAVSEFCKKKWGGQSKSS